MRNVIGDMLVRFTASKGNGDCAAKGSARRSAQCGALKTLRSVNGFTLTEVLATVIIVGLVSAMLAGGVMLANKQFSSSMARSQAQELYSTLAKTLDNDLRYTGEFDNSDKDKGVHYYSEAHGAEIPDRLYLKTLTDDGNIQDMHEYGQLALCTEDGSTISRLLGRGAYNNGLVARVDSFSYDPDFDCFVIKLSVARLSDTASPIIDGKQFTVKALNYSQ